MYKYKVISKHTKTSEHLEDKILELNSAEEGKMDFNKPWDSKFLNLTESEWKELFEKGELIKTEVVKKTTFISVE